MPKEKVDPIFRNLTGDRLIAAKVLSGLSQFEIITSTESGNVHSQNWISKWGLSDFVISAENGPHMSTWVFKVPRHLAAHVRAILNQSTPA
jgi:hypothetical protein